jgi:glycerate 2-kinase
MGTSSGTEDIWQILRYVVGQLEPRELVANALSFDDAGNLGIQGISETFPLPGRVVVVAVGKASVPMATGAVEVLGDRATELVAVTKAGIPLSVDPPNTINVIESDHPVPTQRSLDAGRHIRELVEDLGRDDLVLMLISGGGSALVEDLVDGVTLDDLQNATDHLLRAGAKINELNAVRRRISRLKGGRLARAAAPAKLVNLIISDVLNSPLQDIASGPTVEPPESDETFKSVMRRSDLLEGLPASVRDQLKAQQAQDEPWPESVVGTTVLADASTAARAAIASAVGLGYRVQSLGFDFQGEAREFGRTWGTIARHAVRHDTAFERPIALIGSGELTVTVRGDGTGGRNTEMALAAAVEIADYDELTICSFATDGDDGVSGCAGGVVNGDTLELLERNGIDAMASLAENDSATALSAAEATIDIGPTGTNVNDVYIALVRDET